MSTVNYAIIHQLDKEKHGKATYTERKKPLEITDSVRKLILDIHRRYAGKANKGYGRFNPDETNYPSSATLRDIFFDKKKTFLDGSVELLRILAAKANPVALATGGFVLMAQITNDAQHSWFLVAILNNVESSLIREDTLDVVDAAHVNVDDIRVAGRVSLTEWQNPNNNTRYVGFLKPKGDVSDYFKEFLGCQDALTGLAETKKLTQALKKFATDNELTANQKDQLLKDAFEYCDELAINNSPLILDSLANRIWPAAPDDLKKIFASDGHEVSDGFVPDRRALKTLVRLKYKTNYWSLDIDRAAIGLGYASYDDSKKQLTLLKLPPELQAELEDETRTNEAG